MAEERIRVRFSTKYAKFRVTDAPFAIPSKLGRYGLSEVVNHLLELSTPQPFDFLINDQLIREPLNKFVANHRLSKEDVINIEYIPAVSLTSDSISAELPAWIGCLDTSLDSITCAGCYDGQVHLMDSNTLEIKTKITAHNHPIRDIIAWQNDSTNMFVTASKDQTLKCWKIDNTGGTIQAHQTANLTGHLNSVESVSILSDRSHLLSGDWTGALLCWDLSSLGKSTSLSQTSEGGSKKKRKGDKGQAVAGPVEEVRPAFTIKAHVQAISGITTTKDGRVYTGSWDHSVKEWDIERQDCVATFAGAKVVTSLDFSEHSRLLATSHPDGRVRLWDSRQREEATTRGTFSNSKNWIAQVRWRPSSEFIFACVDYQGSVLLWDTRATSPLGNSEVHTGKGLCLQWGSGGSSSGTGTGSTGMEIEGESVDGSGSHRVVTGGSDCCVYATNDNCLNMILNLDSPSRVIISDPDSNVSLKLYAYSSSNLSVKAKHFVKTVKKSGRKVMKCGTKNCRLKRPVVYRVFYSRGEDLNGLRI
eukprot:gene4734-9403_t